MPHLQQRALTVFGTSRSMAQSKLPHLGRTKTPMLTILEEGSTMVQAVLKHTITGLQTAQVWTPQLSSWRGCCTGSMLEAAQAGPCSRG